ARGPVVRGRTGDVAPARIRVAGRPAALDDRPSPRTGRLRGGARTLGEAAPRQPARSGFPVRLRPGARGDRLASPGDPATGQRPDGAHAVAARCAARARARPRAALRLPREPAPIRSRDSAVLPPGG